MPQFLRFSLFPIHAEVVDGSGEKHYEHYKTRTIVTDDEVFVYIDGPSGQVEVGFTDRLIDFQGNAREGWTATTEDGYTVSLSRVSSCSCGSRLKGYNPFPGVPIQAMT